MEGMKSEEANNETGVLNQKDAMIKVQEYLNTLEPKRVDYSLENKGQIPGKINALNSSSYRCVDGRYEEEGRLAVPGGALGLLFMLNALTQKLGIKKSIAELRDEFENLIGTLSFHTDDHNLGSEYLCAGCGHAMLVQNAPEKYGIEPNVLDNLQLKRGSSYEGKEEVLRGDHKELAVVIINDEKEVILPAGYTPDKSTSFFVFHRGVAIRALSEIANALGYSADKVRVEEIVDMHAKLTLDSLSKKLGRNFVILSV